MDILALLGVGWLSLCAVATVIAAVSCTVAAWRLREGCDPGNAYFATLPTFTLAAGIVGVPLLLWFLSMAWFDLDVARGGLAILLFCYAAVLGAVATGLTVLLIPGVPCLLGYFLGCAVWWLCASPAERSRYRESVRIGRAEEQREREKRAAEHEATMAALDEGMRRLRERQARWSVEMDERFAEIRRRQR